MHSDLPSPAITHPRRGRPSIVWAIPIIAALIGLALVAQVLWQHGPRIAITFASAEGIEPGKTKVKFKNVDIGQVKSVQLAPDRTHVIVSVDLIKEAAPFAVEDSRFWVVRPRLAGTGVSGLGTLLSGAYIGVDAGHSDVQRDSFTGEENPPVVASDVPGRRFALHADDIGSLDMGSPVFFRRIQVGHVESVSLDADGSGITMGVFIKSPYDHFVTNDSRFWHASGVDLRMDAGGVKLETQSLATILMGGIAFETPPSANPAPPALPGTSFNLAPDHMEALKAPDGTPQTLVLHFQQSVRGLNIGAPVDFRGVDIGRVRSFNVVYDQARGEFTSPVVVDIYPQRLGQLSDTFSESTPTEKRLALLSDMVRHGLRAQLRSGNLLTGQLYVALDFFPQAKPAAFNPRINPVELPTVPSDLQEVQQQVQSILRKLDKIPFETLGQDVHKVMASLDSTLRHIDALSQRTDREMVPELRQVVHDLHQTMTEMQANLAGDAPLQQETRQALRGMAEAARSLKALTDSLEHSPEALIQGKKGNAP